MIFKRLLEKKPSRFWFIFTVIISVLMIAINAVAIYWSGIISIALRGDIAHKAENAEDAVVYYEKSTSSKDEANAQAQSITQRIAEEGFILLKNDNALPLKKSAQVSVFGKNSVNLVYGGSGSGGGDATLPKKTLYESLTSQGIVFNPVLKAFYEDNTLSGPGRESNSGDLDSGDTVTIGTGETPQSSYTNTVKNSYADYADAAIVVFSRVGGEGFDLPMVGANGARHYLDLDTNERDLLESVCASDFEHVIVVLNTLNIMETGFLNEYDGKIDACIWIGGPGSTGIMALGRILDGTVTPSGHTTNTWPYDFKKDPTWNNFSERGISKGDIYFNTETNKNTAYNYVNYEEGIYVGYRYYETRAAQEREKNGNDNWYIENVAFPFGYGLSYTTFKWELTNSQSIDGVKINKNGNYSVTVNVINTGSYKGKEVVQMYAKLPYTANGVEKPYVVLCGYAKTDMLYPTAEKAINAEEAAGNKKPNSQKITITFSPYDIASYDYSKKSGHEGYIIESGAYELLLCSDAHTSKFSVPFSVEDDIVYENDPITNTRVVNRYTNCADSAFNSDTMIADFQMSRNDLSILPDAYQDADRQVTTEFINLIADLTHNNPNAAGITEMPKQGKVATMDLAGVLQYDAATQTYYANYDDNASWDVILDAVSINSMLNMYNTAAFKTNKIDNINKPQTLESDGPVGWCNFISLTDPTWKGNNVYTSQVVMSATWNVDLIEEMGKCVGEEGLWGAVNSDGRPYSGWYAPGVNIHRSQFGGRNFEYFSEDSYLTGTMGAAEIKGCQSKGVYCYVKHFAVNEQETHRMGACNWLTEQALRELYLKPFEIVVKQGKTRAMMSSFTRIGTRWTGGDYRLLTEILRDEWGFRGTVICDYNATSNFMNCRQMVYAGGDLNLCSSISKQWNDFDSTSAVDVTMLRNATKNVLYTVANSNAMNSLSYYYTLATWKICLIVADVLTVLGLAVWGILAIRKSRKML
ncbi:MAG: glycoside hydrolase family 3 C-terminal domain-containing protein [Candidatus Izemoplasmatales bacterium]|jgi:beta-glucosidase